MASQGHNENVSMLNFTHYAGTLLIGVISGLVEQHANRHQAIRNHRADLYGAEIKYIMVTS